MWQPKPPETEEGPWDSEDLLVIPAHPLSLDGGAVALSPGLEGTGWRLQAKDLLPG